MGKGIANRLEQSGIRTIGEIAHADEDMLYRMFGVDAELLIDHAWGRESTTMQDIKSYRPKTNSLSPKICQWLMIPQSLAIGFFIQYPNMILYMLCCDIQCNFGQIQKGQIKLSVLRFPRQ